MAGLATDIWEFRAASGAANAGGGFDTASGGTDYSNQDSAQLQLTDLATGGIGSTALSSATGGLTAAMIGNYIQIRSGTNVVAGWYRVTAHTDTNNVTIDRAADDGVGGVASGSGDLGGAMDVLTDTFVDDASTLVAGNTIHIKNDGTMTLTAAAPNTQKDGTLLLPITIEGYNTTRGDVPTATNRPVIAAGANVFRFDDFWHFKNLIITTTNSLGMDTDSFCLYRNMKSTNSSGTANRNAFTVELSSTLIECEAISTNGVGIDAGSRDTRIVSCYLHDSITGIDTNTHDSHVIIGCIFDTCTNGMLVSTGSDGGIVYGCTFYSCTTGISAAAECDVWAIINNIFDACTDGIIWGDADRSGFIDYNCWDNSTDVTNVAKGPNSVTGDPGLTDPANGDFTLGGGSNCLNTGLDANNTTEATV